MSLHRILVLMGRDLSTCPRSPIILWLFAMPLLITFFIQVVFTNLFDSEPVLGIYTSQESVIADSLIACDGIRVISAEETELAEMVENGAVDAGLILRDSFEDSVRSGARPELQYLISPEGSPAGSAVLLLLVLDELRSLENRKTPLEINVISSDEEKDLPLSERIVPSMVLIVMIICGIFIPAFMLVDEREKGTLAAVLVTPVTTGEALLSKGLLGFCLAMPITVFTLVLNGLSGFDMIALLVCFAVGTAVCNCIGLIYGTVARSAKSLYTMVKSLNIILVAPAMFYIFPGWPGWVAKLFPTYWFMDPAYRVIMHNAHLPDVLGSLAVASATVILLGFVVVILGRRMQNRLTEA